MKNNTASLKIAITGISHGLGNVLSNELAKRGHKVYGCVHHKSNIQVTQENLTCYTASVTDPSEMQKFADFAVNNDTIDIVIANAGVIHKRKFAWEIPVNEWERVMNVNVLGVVNTIHAFLPTMLASNKGVFIAISSGWGRSPSWGLGPYCASKFAVEGIIGSLNHDLLSDVRAVALDPGNGVNTEMLAICLPDEHQNYISPLDWAGQAADYIIDYIYFGKISGSLTIPHSGL